MKLAFISYWSCPLERLGVLNAGGMNVYVYNLAISLGKLGHRIDIFTKTHNTKEQKILQLNQNICLIHLPVTYKDPYLDVNPYANNLTQYIRSNNLHYDVLHSHYFYSALIAKVLSQKLMIPSIVTFHTTSAVKFIYGGIKDKKREKRELVIVRESNAIIASTELEKHDLMKYYYGDSKKIFVISPGVNHKVFKYHAKLSSRKKLQLPQSKKIILFVGRIDPIKGIDLLIKAVSDLTKKFPDFENKFRVYIIGGDIKNRNFWHNHEVVKIKKLISSRKLDCCVKFLGSKAHHLLPYYYSAADIVVMPSFHESFGLVVLEAMACRSAVIASKVGGLKYLIKDGFNGRLFENGNIVQFARIIWTLINDVKSRSLLGENAFKTSQKYCWNIQTQKILDIYKKMM